MIGKANLLIGNRLAVSGDHTIQQAMVWNFCASKFPPIFSAIGQNGLYISTTFSFTSLVPRFNLICRYNLAINHAKCCLIRCFTVTDSARNVIPILASDIVQLCVWHSWLIRVMDVEKDKILLILGVNRLNRNRHDDSFFLRHRTLYCMGFASICQCTLLQIFLVCAVVLQTQRIEQSYGCRV